MSLGLQIDRTGARVNTTIFFGEGVDGATGAPYQQLLMDNQFLISMSGTGHCYDNAPIESFFGSLKTELVPHLIYETRAQIRTDIFFYIEAFYNRQRRHSTLGYVSPAAYEAAYYQRQHQLQRIQSSTAHFEMDEDIFATGYIIPEDRWQSRTT
jgi:transposase InsO family protein